jgi:hypothetical protein
VASWLVLSGLVLARAAGAAPDPCLRTLAEARELGGSDTVQAGGGGAACDYLAADSTPRLRIALFDAGSAEAAAALARLGDRERYEERKSGKARTGIAAEGLEGWVLAGQVLASVTAPGEVSAERRRRLELTLFCITEKLR